MDMFMTLTLSNNLYKKAWAITSHINFTLCPLKFKDICYSMVIYCLRHVCMASGGGIAAVPWRPCTLWRLISTKPQESSHQATTVPQALKRLRGGFVAEFVGTSWRHRGVMGALVYRSDRLEPCRLTYLISNLITPLAICTLNKSDDFKVSFRA
jgi:hypothetical protein